MRIASLDLRWRGAVVRANAAPRRHQDDGRGEQRQQCGQDHEVKHSVSTVGSCMEAGQQCGDSKNTGEPKDPPMQEAKRWRRGLADREAPAVPGEDAGGDEAEQHGGQQPGRNPRRQVD